MFGPAMTVVDVNQCSDYIRYKLSLACGSGHLAYPSPTSQDDSSTIPHAAVWSLTAAVVAYANILYPSQVNLIFIPQLAIHTRKRGQSKPYDFSTAPWIAILCELS